MNRKITIAFTEPENSETQRQIITNVIASGFYAYLKKNGYLKKDRSLKQKVEHVLAESRKICDGFGEIDSA